MSCFVFEVTHGRAATGLPKYKRGLGSEGGTQVFASSSCLCNIVYKC